MLTKALVDKFYYVVRALSRGHQIYPVEISQVFSHFAEAKQAKANLVYAIFPDNKAPSNLYRTLAEFGVQRKVPNYRHLPLVSPSQVLQDSFKPEVPR